MVQNWIHRQNEIAYKLRKYTIKMFVLSFKTISSFTERGTAITGKNARKMLIVCHRLSKFRDHFLLWSRQTGL